MCDTGLATITQKGIAFGSRMYSCEQAIKEQWFNNLEEIGKGITVLYRQEDPSVIYLRNIMSNEGICREIQFSLFEGKKLGEYHQALNRMKTVRMRYIRAGLKKRWKGETPR
jgi:hypothetical protein